MRKREERDQRGLVLLFTAWTGLPSTGEPADFVIHPLFTLVRSLFIQCSLLTLRFFGWRTTDSFPMSFPLVRIIRSSYTPCLWYLHNSEFLHYVYNYNTLWGWWGSGGGNPRTNGREGGKLLCKQLPFYFCEYFEGLGFSTRTLGRYARGARPISYVPMEIFLFYKM